MISLILGDGQVGMGGRATRKSHKYASLKADGAPLLVLCARSQVWMMNEWMNEWMREVERPGGSQSWAQWDEVDSDSVLALFPTELDLIGSRCATSAAFSFKLRCTIHPCPIRASVHAFVSDAVRTTCNTGTQPRQTQMVSGHRGRPTYVQYSISTTFLQLDSSERVQHHV